MDPTLHARQGIKANPMSDGLEHRVLPWMMCIVLICLSIAERFMLPWHWWPVWTAVPVVRLLARRKVYDHKNLLEVPLV